MPAHIVFVTGKGGTGKSTLARAIASRAAAAGKTAALVRLRSASDGDEEAPRRTRQEPQEIHRGLGRRGSGKTAAEPRGTLHEICLDERRDLEEFLTRMLRIGFLARRLLDSRTFSAVAAAAPGLRDLVTLTAITALASSKGLSRGGLVVVDAPATGHSVPLLEAPGRVLELSSAGPVAREARDARRLLLDPGSFTPLLVTTPEELAVREVVSLHRQLLDVGIAHSRVVVNGMWPVHLDRADGARLVASAVSSDCVLHWRRHQRQSELVAELEATLGPCPRIAFSFQDGALPEGDVDALLERLLEETVA